MKRKRARYINKATSLSMTKIFIIVVGSIPDFEDIPKTTDTFWKETTWSKLIYGSDGGAKVKIYKDKASAFIRCHHIESNDEFIHILQHDETISEGIFRERWDDGYTAIGSRYFRRSGREEERVYRLFRYNKSGDIYYYDEIYGKDDSAWRYLAKYRFNQETLEWKKLKVE